ncbi:hypothetical protein [Arthrobacter sp. K5]|uniref:Uncharacterized protein n=1 Tax=Arthrobacter sp. K5 TaxID=2839623 RepID=A0AAU8ERP7_9MICC
MDVGTADPAVGAELAQGLAVVSGGIGGQAHGLADSGKASSAPAGSEGVLERELRLVVEKPSGHDEVAGNPFRAV